MPVVRLGELRLGEPSDISYCRAVAPKERRRNNRVILTAPTTRHKPFLLELAGIACVRASSRSRHSAWASSWVTATFRSSSSGTRHFSRSVRMRPAIGRKSASSRNVWRRSRMVNAGLSGSRPTRRRKASWAGFPRRLKCSWISDGRDNSCSSNPATWRMATVDYPSFIPNGDVRFGLSSDGRTLAMVHATYEGEIWLKGAGDRSTEVRHHAGLVSRGTLG